MSKPGAGDFSSVTLTLATSCDHCAQPIPINGPVQVAQCPHCEKGTPVSHLYEILSFAAARAKVPAEYQYAWFDGAGPECPGCGADVPLASVRSHDGAATAIPCASCGQALPVYPAPSWLKQHLPTTVQVFGGDADVARAQGGVDLKIDERSAAPVVLNCPSCGGGLTLAQGSERTISCQFCSASVFIPDELWRRLHPVKTMVRWTLTYTGRIESEKLLRWEQAQQALQRAQQDLAALPAPRADAASADARRPKPASTPRKPMSRLRFVLVGLAIVSFVSLMGAVLGTGCISGTCRMAAPLVCPKGYTRSVVVLHVGGTMNGGTSYHSDLWCVFADPDRQPEMVNEMEVVGVQFGEYAAAGMLLVALALLRRRRTA